MPPVNDDLASRILLSGVTFNVSGDNTGATLEVGEADLYLDFDYSADHSVWYEYVPSFDGVLTIDLCDSVGIDDSVLWVFTGDTIGSLSLVGANDDYCGFLSRLTISVSQGVSYKISVTGFDSGEFGSFVLNGVLQTSPTNDRFTQAQSCTMSDFPISADNSVATTEVGEPTSHYNSLWYSFSSSLDGTLHLTVGNNFRLAVYTGSNLTELQQVTPLTGSNNNITVPVFSYISYKIVVYCPNDSAFGIFTVNASFIEIPRPTNDYFTNNTELTGITFNETVNNSLATIQVFEDPTNYFSVWYSYTPTESGVFTLSQTSGISLNFKSYIGTTIQNLVEVETADDSISFMVQANVTYYIAVSSQNSTTYGAFTLSGAFTNELSFKYTETSTPVQYNGSYQKIIVRESDTGRIWILHDNFPDGVGNTTRVFYSDDEGIVWNEDTQQIDNVSTLGMSLFFDSSENLLVLKNIGNNLRMYKRAKSGGSWTSYDATAPSAWNGISSISSHQTDDGVIHIIITVIDGSNLTDPFSSSNYYNNIYYTNFLNGTFETITKLTNYGNTAHINAYGDYPTDYQDTIDGSPIIVSYNGDLLVLWSMIYYYHRVQVVESLPFNAHAFTFGTSKFQYCIKSTNMDIPMAAHAWTTARNYNVDECMSYSSQYYKCIVQHTSGNVTTDISNGKWAVISSYSIPTVLKEYDDKFYGNTPQDYQYNNISFLRATTDIYYMLNTTGINNLNYYKLYKNYVDNTPSDSWSDWMTPLALEVAENDDLMLYGLDNRVFNSPSSVIARIDDTWREEHTTASTPSDGFVAGHTYNFEKFR